MGVSRSFSFFPSCTDHYTFFLWIYAFPAGDIGGRNTRWIGWRLFENEWSAGLAMAVASIAVTHGWRFWNGDLQGRSFYRSCPFLTMVYPYRRLLICTSRIVARRRNVPLPSMLAILFDLGESGLRHELGSVFRWGRKRLTGRRLRNETGRGCGKDCRQDGRVENEMIAVRTSPRQHRHWESRFIPRSW